jgi:protein-S-isoprenylcysteine O-methyltransferase Ste14
MPLASRIIMLSKFFLLATYLVQAAQIFFFSVPSAGSTIEMLSKVRKSGDAARHHPANRILESSLKVAMMITATVLVTLTFFSPLLVECFPDLAGYFGLLTTRPSAGFRLASMFLFFTGNLISTIAVYTLKRRVAFHEFGETKTLCTAGIYRFLRNPISAGSAAIFAGFFFYLPSVVTAVGIGLFMLNSELRIRMEELYLERTFGDAYRRYKEITGKYLPKIHI